MGKTTKITWTDVTWNISVGCTKVDEDCKYCYMYRDSMDAKRFDPKVVRKTKTVFNLPLTLKEPSKIFTCSYTDFFHPAIDAYRDEAWDIIRKCPQHVFQILTKRPERIDDHLPPDWHHGWNNVWLGTSVGHSKGIDRMIDLKKTLHFGIKFLSLEPLHGAIDLDQFFLSQFEWVIVGGESGNETGKYRYRPCELEWIRNIVAACRKANIPVFVKQMGTYLSKQLHMSDRHGTKIEDFPADLRLQQFPVPVHFKEKITINQ